MIASIDFVGETFARFNSEIFDGKLPPIEMKLSHARTFVGKVQYRIVRGAFGRVKGYTGYVLRISTLFDLPVEELEDVVIHEMIHYWILLNGLRDTSTHGKLFREKMAQINRDYGRHITVSHKMPRDGSAPAFATFPAPGSAPTPLTSLAPGLSTAPLPSSALGSAPTFPASLAPGSSPLSPVSTDSYSFPSPPVSPVPGSFPTFPSPLAPKVRVHYVCISELKDGAVLMCGKRRVDTTGKYGITVCSEDKVDWLKRRLPRAFPIKSMQWYTSTNPFYNRYPHARTVKLYVLNKSDLPESFPEK